MPPLPGGGTRTSCGRSSTPSAAPSRSERSGLRHIAPRWILLSHRRCTTSLTSQHSSVVGSAASTSRTNTMAASAPAVNICSARSHSASNVRPAAALCTCTCCSIPAPPSCGSSLDCAVDGCSSAFRRGCGSGCPGSSESA
eukprot:6860108-Prymnesium_polylepis.1